MKFIRDGIITAGLILSCTPAFATTWYVDSARGSDSTNNGTSILTPFATLQKAANSTAAGDTVYVLPGSGYGGGTSGTAPLVISTSGSGASTSPGGTCTSPITYTAFPGTQPVISGTRAQGAIMGVSPLSCIVINGFNIAGWNGALTWPLASANYGGSGTTWQNLNYNGDGIYFDGYPGHILHHFVISNNYIHDFPLDGIALNFTDYNTVSGNTVSANGLYSPYAGSGIALFELHNIDAGTGTKNLISGNNANDNYNLIPNRASGTPLSLTTSQAISSGTAYINVSSSSGVGYSYSVIDPTNGCVPPNAEISYYGTGYIGLTIPLICALASGATLLLQYITDGEGIIITDNKNVQSDSVAYVGRTLITNNIAYNNGSSGISISASNNVDATFNTLYLNQTVTITGFNGELGDYQTNGSNIYNNISYASSTVPSGYDESSGTTTFAYNLFYGGNASHTLPGTNNVTINPQFVLPNITSTPNFNLGPTSPAIGAANGSTYSRLTDFAGGAGSTNSSYDMGAYQTQNCSLAGTPSLKTLGPLLSEFSVTGAGTINAATMRDLINTLYCTAQ